MEVYDACEATVTRYFCRSSKALQAEWARCKEVLDEPR